MVFFSLSPQNSFITCSCCSECLYGARIVTEAAAQLRQENATLTSKLHMTQQALAAASARVTALEAALPLPVVEIEMTEAPVGGSEAPALATLNPLFAYSVSGPPSALESSAIELAVSAQSE